MEEGRYYDQSLYYIYIVFEWRYISHRVTSSHQLDYNNIISGGEGLRELQPLLFHFGLHLVIIIIGQSSKISEIIQCEMWYYII